jgi:hypothetical protein
MLKEHTSHITMDSFNPLYTLLSKIVFTKKYGTKPNCKKEPNKINNITDLTLGLIYLIKMKYYVEMNYSHNIEKNQYIKLNIDTNMNNEMTVSY